MQSQASKRQGARTGVGEAGPFTTGPVYFLPLSLGYVLQQRDVILYPHLEYVSVSLLMPFGILYIRNDTEIIVIITVHNM